ncbi:MAG: AMP-binding protein, partial [Nevskiales bacterium]
MTLAAYSHQDAPFEQVVEAVRPPRSLSHSPIFQVVFVLQNAPQSELGLSGLTLGAEEIPRRTAQFDLSLELQESGPVIQGALGYASDLFDSATIERWVGHLTAILSGMVQDVRRPMHELSLLGSEERLQVLEYFNETQIDFPQDLLVHQMFERQAREHPDSIAVEYEGERLSYRQLNQRANQLAHRLIDQGVVPDSLVAICVDRGIEMVVAVIGVLKAGGAYVPVDPAYPAERIGYMLEDAEPRVILTQQRLKAGLPKTSATIIALDGEWNEISTQPKTNPSARKLGLTPRHLAYVIYTSGSTGLPKGVMLEHRGLCNLALTQVERLGLHADSRILQFASFSFDACTWDLAMAWSSGACLHLAPRERLMPGAPLVDVLQQQQISHVLLAPVAIAALPADVRLDSLQTLLAGGEACSRALVQQWAPGRRFINCYGPTEATVCVSMYDCAIEDDAAPPVGRPLANTRIY